VRILQRARPLELPDLPYAYAAPALPSHFDRRTLRRLDNAPASNRMADERAMLGRMLFYDTRLSANDRMSCATCHLQKHAFSDPRRVSKGIHGDRGRRNSMSLVNLRYQGRGGFFWDERADTLEAQALMPIEDPTEMAYDVDDLVVRLSADPTYAALFLYAFDDHVITPRRIGQALAQFVRSIVSYRSKFDEGMRQVDSVVEDFPNFSKLENEGKRLFFGLEENQRGASCASCHVPGRGPGAAGDLGRVAIFQGGRPGNNGLDDEIGKDAGVGEVTEADEDRGLFKIPTLRNIELTAPYMHDGRFRKLKDVLEHYRRGVKPHPNLDRRLGGGDGRAGGPGRGRSGPRGLSMTVKQRNALLAFLKTLTDDELIEDPRFSDPWR